MKRLVCEVCGGNDVLKDNDLYICQTCGVKYTIESVQKLLVEVNDTVNNDNKLKQEFEELIQTARNEKEKGSDVYCAYYRQALEIMPNDWEAYFFGSVNAPDVNTTLNYLFNSTLSDQKKHEACKIIAENSDLVGRSFDSVYYENIEKLADLMIKLFPNETDTALQIYINALKVLNRQTTYSDKKIKYTILMNKIHKINPNFVDPQIEINRKKEEESRQMREKLQREKEEKKKEQELKNKRFNLIFIGTIGDPNKFCVKPNKALPIRQD